MGMRDTLAELMTRQAKADPSFIVLTGDHGDALFREYRGRYPGQFLNCGIAEQNMVGVAAGLYKTGFTPVVYGLAAFVPMRVMEQIKLDICFSPKRVVFIGDGAGTEMYGSLGASHQCVEDVECLRTLPQMTIYEPETPEELKMAFNGALTLHGPSYIRISQR